MKTKPTEHLSAEHTPFDLLDRWLSAALAPLAYVGLGMALCAALMLIPQAI